MTTLINRSRPRSAAAGGRRSRSQADHVAETRTIRVGLLGCGTVGHEIAAQLIAMKQRSVNKDPVRIELSRILVKDPVRHRGFDPTRFVTRFDDVLAAEPDVIIEAIGGLDPAGTFIEAALRRGIPVVTANKSLIAHEGLRLQAIAQRHDAALFCEACVGGAAPILASLRQLRGDRIRSIRGIVNGTCNDILSRMTSERMTLDESLREAIRAGLAEPDPSADISGRDSAEKLCVLAAAAGFGGITPDHVETTGIEAISTDDIDAARSHGYSIKLIAEFNVENGILQAHVGPTLVPKRDPLARAVGPHNVMFIDAELAGTLVLQGAGAGPKPTASAILGDLQRAIGGERSTIESAPVTLVATDIPRPRFGRFSGLNEQTAPEAWLNAFNAHGVDVRQVHLRKDSVEVFTGPVCRTALAGACRSIDAKARLFVADVMGELQRSA